MVAELFHPGFRFTPAMSKALERDGHVLLPGVCLPATIGALTEAVQRHQKRVEGFTITAPHAVQVMDAVGRADASPEGSQRAMAAFQRLFHEQGADSGLVGPCPADHDRTLGLLVGNPDLLELMRSALSADGGRDASKLFFDACTLLNRLPGTNWADGGMGVHSHMFADGYARDTVSTVDGWEDKPGEAMIRAFFYISGFNSIDGGCLKVIPGSHTWRDPGLGSRLLQWRGAGKTSHEGVPLTEVELECPPGSVILMHTHAAHGVTPMRRGKAAGAPRWAFVACYRIGESWSPSRNLTSAFASRDGPGLLTAEMKRQGRGLMPPEHAEDAHARL